MGMMNSFYGAQNNPSVMFGGMGFGQGLFGGQPNWGRTMGMFGGPMGGFSGNANYMQRMGNQMPMMNFNPNITPGGQKPGGMSHDIFREGGNTGGMGQNRGPKMLLGLPPQAPKMDIGTPPGPFNGFPQNANPFNFNNLGGGGGQRGNTQQFPPWLSGMLQGNPFMSMMGGGGGVRNPFMGMSGGYGYNSPYTAPPIGGGPTLEQMRNSRPL